MLKIKEDKMQELEKFGFKQYLKGRYNYMVKTDYIIVGIYINENREIYCDNWVLDKLFDLIQAGFVEKAGEQKLAEIKGEKE